MADCLQNATELVEGKRNYARVIGSITLSCGEMNILADAYENILSENARLKAERDAATGDLLYDRSCFACKYHNTATCGGCHIDKDRWEWRGVHEKNPEEIGVGERARDEN